MQKSFDKPLTIIGIDPGTTLGYAILDLEGNLLKADSSKQLNLSSLISEVIKLGKPIIAASDVNPAPDLVRSFAAKTGSKIIIPKEDLLVKEKRQLTADFNTKDIHQMDSLASAMYAYNELKPLLLKIDKILAASHKQAISQKVKEIVIKKGLSINDAISILETPTILPKKIIPAEPLELTAEQLKEKNSILNEKLISAQREISLLKEHNFSLKKELESSKSRQQFVLKKIFNASKKEKLDKTIAFNQKALHSLSKEIEAKKSELSVKAHEIAFLNRLLSSLNENYLIKKLETLSFKEFEHKNRLLNIKEKDILLVNDLDISSDKTILTLKNKVFLILYKKASKKTLAQLPFTLLDANTLNLAESNLFATTNKTDLEKAKANAEMLKKIVAEYRQERF